MTRRGETFLADFISGVAVFPCEGLRDEAADHALAAAFEEGGYQSVKHLRRTDDVPDAIVAPLDPTRGRTVSSRGLKPI